MCHNKLVFETTDSMGNFEPTNFIKPTVDFEIPFSHIMELQNIPKLLNDYLKENNLLDQIKSKVIFKNIEKYLTKSKVYVIINIRGKEII